MSKLVKIKRTANFPKVGAVIREWGPDGLPGRFLRVEKVKFERLHAASTSGEICWAWGREISEADARAQRETEDAARPAIPAWS